ncbi:hypothetical protein FDENT_2963 [Fusarium denticulatum]|uniref:Uncharacterized protein n=1 Tax=Fusarium denticulatum TaxID=48507 RepID=A0A8H6CTE8_9HYPO|nr:hypothetical protein FDENT_2963 [Fusarium denticulatum]
MSTTTASTSPTDVGQALINALNNSTSNLTRSLLVMDEDGSFTGKHGSRFILQSYGYLDLRVSLVASLTFPADAPSFESLYPKASLQSLNLFDPLLYQETETAVLDFWNACNDFNQYGISSFWTVFDVTKLLCQNLIDQLTGAGEGSLQGILGVLTSQTYSEPGSENNSEFKGLAQNASSLLSDLSQDANQRASTIQGLATSIASQASKIQATTTEVDAVVNKFGFNSQGHYIAALDFKLAMLQKVLNDKFGVAQTSKENWVSLYYQMRQMCFHKLMSTRKDRELMEASTAVSYIWIPVAGWISGSNAILTEQRNVGMAWAEYQGHIAHKSTDAVKTTFTLIGAVNLLWMQNQVICDKLRSVGVALQEIQSTFAAIGSNLGQAATLMAVADGSVRTSLIANQAAIQAGIAKAVKELQDTLSAVQALITIDSNIQTTGITADIDAPSVYAEETADGNL